MATDYLTIHYLDPDTLGVKRPTVDTTGWVARHREALAHPRGPEATTLALARAVKVAASRYTIDADWLWVTGVVAPLLDAFQQALDYDCGRLDCGTLDNFRVRVAEQVGLDPDTHQEARS